MVIQFPSSARAERERTLDVAAKAIPLLEAALDCGNAALLRELFAVLGDVARGADATARLAEITIEDAEVVGFESATRRTSKRALRLPIARTSSTLRPRGGSA